METLQLKNKNKNIHLVQITSEKNEKNDKLCAGRTHHIYLWMRNQSREQK